MEVIETPLKDCFIIKVPVFGDDRGFFLESFNQRRLKEEGIDFEVRQINFAKSEKNVLRGLHYQKEPNAQSKLVGVINGAVLDVVVDIRPESPTYLRHYKIILDSNDTFLLVPKGFAHGYHTLKDETIFYYAVDQFYDPDSEKGIRFDDQKLKIDWELTNTPKVSEKDLKQPYL
ncbi:MAG: dTDP-4-dehydrorhamnose 3,5-epimerase [Cyclobacteriaceae bacterium]